MKFDIARAWKDETYRQSLSAEQLNTLPANPVGELSDADLATIFGGGGGGGLGSGGGPGGPGGPIAAIAPVAPVAAIVPVSLGSVRNESVALICEVNIFSINVNVINLLASLTQVCIKG